MTDMWRYRQRRRDVAASAVTDLVHDAVLWIRLMAVTRQSMCDDMFPGTDYAYQIRALADLCDTLVPGLRPGQRPSAALRYTWSSRSPGQQQWIRRCLHDHGLRVE